MSGLPPEGWYPDPRVGSLHHPALGERWWNGAQWTAHTRPAAPPLVGDAKPAGASFLDAFRPADVLPDGTPLADVGPRLAAHALDVVLVVVVGSILASFVTIPWWLLAEPASVVLPLGAGLVDAVVVAAAWLGYQLGFRRSGATLGKRLLRLRTRPLDADGPLTAGQVLRRSVAGSGMLLFAMFPAVPVIGLALFGYDAFRMSKDPLGRPWHDDVAGTVVVRDGS